MKKQAKSTMGLLFTLGILCASFQPAFADWDAETVLFDKDCSAINNPDFLELKSRVKAHLQDSWCSQEKADLLMDLVLIERPQVCVEVGVFTGSSLLPIGASLAFLKQGTVYAVDAWSNDVATRYWADNDPNKPWWNSLNMQNIFNIFYRMLETWGLENYCLIRNMPSELAIYTIPKIDFLHLDGDYSEIGSMRDVERYLPMVKSGGYILLSNLFIMINAEQPKMKAFCTLFESCEMVCEIEHDNAILFRKN